ncbi:MAG: aquaporin [Lentimicrobiaceae bacterium]|nr:aquaporin [Lentimicrobiaceae bacterium]
MFKKFIAEMTGTMVLVLLGCGAAVFNAGGAGSAAWVLTVAFAFGLAVVAMAYTIGPISGCHINPAITVAAWISGRMKCAEATVYVAAQLAGAFIGSAVLYALVNGGIATGGVTETGANNVAEGGLMGAAIAETVLTFIFVLVVLGTTYKTNNAPKFAGLAIGLTLVLVHIVGIPITGTSVNPARSIAPAVFEGGTALCNLWVFIVFPLIGAALSALVWKVFEVKKQE